MSCDLFTLFNLTDQPNMEQTAALPAVSRTLAFDNFRDFLEQRQRITRKFQPLPDAAPKPDYSQFANHVFFDSAILKFGIAKNSILTVSYTHLTLPTKRIV